MESGFYWVRFKDEEEWTIGKYTEDARYPWEVVASDEMFTDASFLVIDPRVKGQP